MKWCWWKRKPNWEGTSKQVSKLPPSQPPYEELQDADLAGLIGELTGRANVTDLYRRSGGQHCRRPLHVRCQPSSKTVSRRPNESGLWCWPPVRSRTMLEKLEHLGYGKLADVITAADLEASSRPAA